MSFPSDASVFSAPAKINLFLHITGRRANGYHDLQTLFQILDYGDRIGFVLRDDAQVRRCSDVQGVAAESDLMVKAAKLLQTKTSTDRGVDLYIEKVLPMGGGLGGGSSDAATVLCVLNKLWSCGLSEDALANLGLQLGADVPVFVRGRTAWGEGVGEFLSPMKLPEAWYLVVKPEVVISTAKLFSSSRLTRDCDAIRMSAFKRGQGENVFEPLVKNDYPEVQQVIDWLGQFSKSRLTGTGSCVFAEFDSEEAAQETLQRVPENWRAFVAKGVNESPLHTELIAFN